MTTRLNKSRREILMAFAKRNVECPKEKEAADRAYNRAADLVSGAVKKRFPEADMALLQKYEVARSDRCINGGSPEGAFTRFEFRGDDARIPLVPGHYCSARSVQFNKSTADAIAQAAVTERRWLQAIADKEDMYRALIRSARTFEEVLEAWPAAAHVAEAVGQTNTAVSVITSEVIAKIRADNAGADLTPEAAE